MTKICYGLFGVFVCIFDSMLKIVTSRYFIYIICGNPLYLYLINWNIEIYYLSSYFIYQFSVTMIG